MYFNITVSNAIKKATALCIAILLGVILSSAFVSKSQKNIVSMVAVTATEDTVQTKSDNKNCVQLPILMYHSLLKDKRLQGTYVISPDLFEEDLKYITNNGYTTVTATDLVEYVYNDKPLPDKPIMLTFDDGNYNNYSYAYELLKKYNCKAVLAPIASACEKFSITKEVSVSFGYCTFETLKEMASSGYVEIANHTYNLHNSTCRMGVAQKKSESDTEYLEFIREDISKAQRLLKENVGTEPFCLTYPFGAYNSKSEKLLKEMGFKVTLVCEERVNQITKDKNCLYLMGRFLRNNTEPTEHLFERIEA